MAIAGAASGAGAGSADLRHDRLTGLTSLVVPTWETVKAADPTVIGLELPVGTRPCPFCPEQMDRDVSSAGEETARVAGADRHRAWSSLALQNRWPHTVERDAAEVVILSDLHDAHLGSLDPGEATSALTLLLARADAQRAAGRFPLVFVNHGVNAGSSQPHPHGQVIGLPGQDPGSRAESGALEEGRCVLCEELSAERLVARVDGARIVVPEAPAIDYDQTVVLSGHRRAEPGAVALGIAAALRALFAVLGPVAYNLVVHESGHPHVHVTPRTARHSGYELAGIRTCYVAPELAAARLATAARATGHADPATAPVAADPSEEGSGERRSDAA